MFSNLLVSVCLRNIWLCFGFYSHYNIWTCVLPVGNAAIVLRSRLKVRVLKENWEKKAKVDEKGIILTNGDIENGRKAVQYQVDIIIS